MCFCMFFKEAYTYIHMKRYVPIVIGVLALCAVLYVGNEQMKKSNDLTVKEQNASSTTSFNGSITRVFEGDNVLEYGFNLPETATTTITNDGSLIKVSDNGSPVLAMYISFEGGRGYSPADYITNTIVPKVQAVTSKGMVTIGSHDWDVVESEWSVWHVTKTTNGNWLLVVENKKSDNEPANAILESIVTK